MAEPETKNHENDNDPYAFLLELCYISSSQEEILRNAPFVGADTQNYHDTPSPASAGIVMVSAPDSQHPGTGNGVPPDVFHTPPEEPSLLSSDGSEFVDLGRDSELGFSKVQLTQETEAAECSHGARGDVLGDIRGCQIDEFGDFEREITGLDESPMKKSKLSEHDLGFDSSGNCLGKVVSESDGGVNLCESDKVACTVEGSEMRERSHEEPGRSVLPSSMRGRLENAAERGEKKNVFDVFKILSENRHDHDNDNDNDCLSLLKVVKARGMTFP